MTESMTIMSSIGAAILSGGFISALVSIYKAKSEAEKNDAEKNNLISQAAKNLIEPLNDRIEDLERLVATLRTCDDENKIKIQRLEKKTKELLTKNNQLINGINILINQIQMGGSQPLWKPTADLCTDTDLNKHD